DLQLIIKELADLLSAEFRFDLITVRLFEPDGSLTVCYEKSFLPGGFPQIKSIRPEDDYFLHELLLSRRPQFANDTRNLKKQWDSAATPLDIFSAFAHIPIVGDEEPLGVLSIYSVSIVGMFTEELLNLLSSLAGQLALAVKLVDEREAREKEKNAKDVALLKNAAVMHEMEIAKQIQMSLLPEAPPLLPGVQIASLSVAADHVGGDYYDFFVTDDRIIDTVIADVSGHNVGAALIMVETRSVLRAQINTSSSPASVLTNLNTLLMSDLTRAELFISMFYVKYDTFTQWLTYSSAGHNKPVIYRIADDQCITLDAEGMILGVKNDVVFEDKSILLDPGDILLLYTDGLTEASNSEDEMFGIE
ncbi:MAG TPA: SpoIIE family protein phosphatase, partial [Geobacteraceae bacterium]|nr:SpoIIE family protein phosphatase [Geobacteraceae bacterium]